LPHLTVVAGGDRDSSLSPKGSVVTGPYRALIAAEGFPRHSPSLACVRRIGVRRYERVYTRGRPRAGQVVNLPDKEFRYLRTVIVTAAVYRRFGSELRDPKVANPSP
jgi:hypothetical protein